MITYIAGVQHGPWNVCNHIHIYIHIYMYRYLHIKTYHSNHHRADCSMCFEYYDHIIHKYVYTYIILRIYVYTYILFTYTYIHNTCLYLYA